MLLSRTLTKQKGSSNNIENPFIVSYFRGSRAFRQNYYRLCFSPK